MSQKQDLKWIEFKYKPGGYKNRESWSQAKSNSKMSIMYVEEVDDNSNQTQKKKKRAYGWILAPIYDPALHPSLQATPWEYKPNFYDSKYQKDVWVKKWVQFQNPVRFISDPLKDATWGTIIQQFKPPPIYRISDDYVAVYGDGGESNLVYPILKYDCLPISEQTKRTLVEDLHNLSKKRKDYQKESPVQDIIDPDLAPYMKPLHTDWVSWKTSQLVKLAQKDSNPESRFREELQAIKKDQESGYFDNLSENIKLRSKYQWIPSEFSVDTQGKVSINSRIHNLPPDPENKALYSCIKQVFQEMVPMFAQLNLIKNNEVTNLQVIVKAQSYEIQPGMSYTGRWHMEGQTENIVAAGVYYPYVGSVEGGNLKFRPSATPQPLYEIETDQEVVIQEGTAVVFSNTVPHRFRKISNLTSDPQKRTFINFFIVDPSQPIASTKTILAPDFLRKVLKYYVKKYLNQTLPSEIASYIVSWVPGVWGSTSAAKSFRQKARQAMVEDKSGWGWVHWGNRGESDFVPSITTWKSNERREGGNHLNHTDSG